MKKYTKFINLHIKCRATHFSLNRNNNTIAKLSQNIALSLLTKLTNIAFYINNLISVYKEPPMPHKFVSLKLSWYPIDNLISSVFSPIQREWHNERAQAYYSMSARLLELRKTAENYNSQNESLPHSLQKELAILVEIEQKYEYAFNSKGRELYPDKADYNYTDEQKFHITSLLEIDLQAKDHIIRHGGYRSRVLDYMDERREEIMDRTGNISEARNLVEKQNIKLDQCLEKFYREQAFYKQY